MSDDTTPPTPPPPPPPPPGGYGVPPAPPPPPYAAPPLGGGGYSAVEAIQYGWARFSKKPTELLVPTLIVAVTAIAVEIVFFLIMHATLLSTDDCGFRTTGDGSVVLEGCGPSFITSLFAYALTSFVVTLFMQALGAGLIKAALDAVDGKAVEAGQVFAYVTKPQVLVTAAIVSALTFVGTLLCYVPGLIVGFLTVFAMFYVVDKDMEPVEAIKASVNLTTSKLGDTVIFYLLGIVVLVVGAILCGIGLLAAVPVVLGGAAYTFRLLNNETVTPPA